MKQNRFTKLMAVGAASALALSTAFAQTTTKETTTTTTGGTTTGVKATTSTSGVSATTTSTSTLDGTGVITTYSPGTEYISVRTESAAAPVRYHWTDSTTIVDIEGNVVDRALLRADLPVKYTYVKEGDRMVVSKVTVQKPLTEIKETTTTTTTTTR